MAIVKWATLLLPAALLMAGCGDFWQSPNGSSSTSFTLTNSGNITLSPGATGSSTITVTPSNSFTGAVALTCAVTTGPSGASSPITCSPSPSSVSITDTTAQTATLTANTTSGTTTGAYDITVTGTSGSVTETTSLCAEVTNSSGSCTTNTAGASGNFYILNSGATPEIVGESIVSGALTVLSGSPWTVPSTPYAMAMAPSGKFLYVSTNSGVYLYTISGGALSSPAQVSTDTAALALQVDTSGSWLIEAIQTSGAVTFAALPINSSTGTDSGGPEETATYTVANAAVQPGQVVIAKDDSNVFAALGAGGAIVVPFNASVASGSSPFGTTASVVPVTNASGSVLSVAVDPSNRLFYVGETLANAAGNSGGLFAFNYSSLGSSTLTAATGSPLASGGLAPNFILPSANGDSVYVANGQGTGSGNISGFSVTASGSTYSIFTGSTVAAGPQPYSLAEDSTATFVLGVNSLGSPYFNAYTFDSTTAGQLDAGVTADTGASPIAIAAAP